MAFQAWHAPSNQLYKGIVLVGEDFLGEFNFTPDNHSMIRYLRGLAYFCPYCGDIWARLVFTDSNNRQMPLETMQVSCEKHPDAWHVSGSLLAGRMEELVEVLPKAALQREFIIYMNRS